MPIKNIINLLCDDRAWLGGRGIPQLVQRVSSAATGLLQCLQIILRIIFIHSLL